MQDRLWFAGVAKIHMATVYRVAFGYLRNRADADDVTQAVLLKLWRSDASFNDDEHVKRWLIRATVHECTSLYRTLCRRPENIDDYVESLVAPDAAETAANVELLRKVLHLPAKYAAPLYLYYYEGYSTAGVAELLGVGENTLRTRMARARRKLKDVLTKGEGQA